MAAPVEVEGLKEFRRELRALSGDSTWTRALGQVNRAMAGEAATWAQIEASGLGGPFAHFADSITGAATTTAARIQVPKDANATFWGAKERTGWNAGHDGRPQHPEWVGSSWDVAGPGGPYAINAALADHLEEIVDGYGDALDDLARKAFPD